ncbi:MAG: hypothetical protein ACI9VS_004228, partial [Candidatus Binatia bacterium]
PTQTRRLAFAVNVVFPKADLGAMEGRKGNARE